MCDLGLPCGKLDCRFTPRNAVETRHIESPYGLNVKKLDLRATIATIPRDADENDASSNQNPHLEFSPGVGSHDCDDEFLEDSFSGKLRPSYAARRPRP
jgi:hypothetical protein